MYKKTITAELQGCVEKIAVPVDITHQYHAARNAAMTEKSLALHQRIVDQPV